MNDKLMQVKAFARQDGLLLALVWTASMAGLMYAPNTSWGPMLMLCTPFFVGWRLLTFRNKALDGFISWRRGWAYTNYTFIYACIVFALVQFVYFRYLDQGRFMQMMLESLELVSPIYEQQGIDTKELTEAMNEAKSITPVNLTFLFFTYNLIIGTIMSPLISLLCKREVRG